MNKISIKDVMILLDEGCPVEMWNGDFPGDSVKARIGGIVYEVVWPSESVEITVNGKDAGRGSVDMPICDNIMREVKSVEIHKIEEAEEWRAVNGFEGLYEVSNLGRIRSLNYRRTGKAKILKPQRYSNGYLFVYLCRDGKRFNKTVHSITAEAFIGPRPKGLQINHLDENKSNNRVENLEYCTCKENNNHGTHNARMTAALTNGKCSKTVLQYDLEGHFIKSWPSIHEVERQLGYDNSSISKCCLGKWKTSHGFIWKYDNPMHK